MFSQPSPLQAELARHRDRLKAEHERCNRDVDALLTAVGVIWQTANEGAADPLTALARIRSEAWRAMREVMTQDTQPEER